MPAEHAGASVGAGNLADVALPMVLVSAAPLLVLTSFASWAMDLGLAQQIWVVSARCFVQLTVLGFVLKPIFVEGALHPAVVLVYATMMALLAANESMSRPKYLFRNFFSWISATIILVTFFVAWFSIAVVIRPANTLDPQYVIPICGMLFGNTINGIALAVNALSTSFVEQQAEIELMLSFGASRYEASRRLLREAVRTGTLPALNGMAIIGLISIPGMMTGQVLGGSPPDMAARYQMMITYTIGTCSFAATLLLCYIVVGVAFTEDDMLDATAFSKAVKPDPNQSWAAWAGGKLGQLWYVLSCTACWAAGQGYRPVGGAEGGAAKVGDAEAPGKGKGAGQSPTVTALPGVRAGAGGPFLEASNLSRDVGGRVLYQGVAVTLKKCGVAFVSGPSGCGKSQMLRAIAGLSPSGPASSLALDGRSRGDFPSSAHWRKSVRYVTQIKVEMPGTPADFIARVGAFKVADVYGSPDTEDMTQDAGRFINEWGMTRAMLTKEWKTLSGGEAQRVLLAIALASKPHALLLDESTSALDLETKLAVEKTIYKYAAEEGIAVLWISHDPEQIARAASPAS
jgi:putative ABC transport system permease protein